MSVSLCTRNGCAGHLGKFASCVDEALNSIVLDGFADETTGSVDALGYYALIIMPKGNDEHFPNPACPDSSESVYVPAGSYILSEDSNGFVTVDRYDTEQEARAVFAEHESAYAAWDSDEDLTGVTCAMYALCGNPATRLYDCGAVGMVATCERCADRTDRLGAR